METQTANFLRRWWPLLLIGAAGVIAAAFYFDPAMAAWISAHQNRTLKVLMKNVSTFGDWPEHVFVGIALLGVAKWRGSRRWQSIFIAMLVACALAGVSARAIKVCTGRARPAVSTGSAWNGPRFSSKYNAFPSGHTAASTAFFATLAFASWRLGAAFLCIPVLVAFSRMYVAAHYFSDVVAAAFLGLLCALAVWSFVSARMREEAAIGELIEPYK